MADGEQPHFGDQPHLPPLLDGNDALCDGIQPAEGEDEVKARGDEVQRGRKGKKQARGKPRQPVEKERPTVRHRYAGPVLHGSKKKTGNDGGGVAVDHFMTVPPLRDKPADYRLMPLIDHEPGEHGQHGKSGGGEEKKAKTQIEYRGVAGH